MKYISRAHIVTLMVLVVIVGGLLLLGERASRIKKIPPSATETTGTIPNQTTDISKELSLLTAGLSQEKKVQTGTLTSSQSPLSYTQALELYKGSVLQFNDECQLATRDRSYRLGNEVMIDNRSAKARTIIIGTVPLVVGPYDFGFMILREKGTMVPVQCEGQQNIGTLSVQ